MNDEELRKFRKHEDEQRKKVADRKAQALASHDQLFESLRGAYPKIEELAPLLRNAFKTETPITLTPRDAAIASMCMFYVQGTVILSTAQNEENQS